MEGTPTPETIAGGPAAPVKRQGGMMRILLRGGLLLFLGLILVVALWIFVALSWSYSKGDRAGFVQKFSQRGWICKTYEGELAMVNLPGTAPDIFAFSVRDEVVAKQINDLMGRRVTLSYEQHRGLPTSCFGETQYFVVGVRPID